MHHAVDSFENVDFIRPYLIAILELWRFRQDSLVIANEQPRIARELYQLRLIT